MEAIAAVKEEAARAKKALDFVRYKEAMGNLLALENTLVTEVEKLLKNG
jgi:hypothetical protein